MLALHPAFTQINLVNHKLNLKVADYAQVSLFNVFEVQEKVK